MLRVDQAFCESLYLFKMLCCYLGFAEEVDDYDETQQLIEENEVNIPRRPRRQIPRTLVSERVRSAIEEIRLRRTRSIARRIVSSSEVRNLCKLIAIDKEGEYSEDVSFFTIYAMWLALTSRIMRSWFQIQLGAESTV